MSVTLTESAATEFKRIAKSQAAEDAAQEGNQSGADSKPTYLRVGIKGGGCSGFNYTMDLADQKNEDDEVFEQHGVAVICDPKSYIYLAGTSIDFRDEMMGRGFVFNNPNASGTCGCGSSFSA